MDRLTDRRRRGHQLHGTVAVIATAAFGCCSVYQRTVVTAAAVGMVINDCFRRDTDDDVKGSRQYRPPITGTGVSVVHAVKRWWRLMQMVYSMCGVYCRLSRCE